MSSNPLEDVVSRQYEEWVYPDPIQDLTSWVVHNWQWFDPSHASKVMWPEKQQRADLDILIAGCGTNQAAVFAFNNPEAAVTAIDVSKTSLEHTEYLKMRHGLDNLTIKRLPIEEAGSLGQTFDLIVSTGVLHHLADPQAGMDALAPLLREDGVMAVMLYATYGRQGVEMMQDIFRELELGQTSRSIQKVREAVAMTPANHPIRSYLEIAPDLNFDAGAVDTFLHGRDRDYTVAQCIELVESGGLVFQDMFLKPPYYPSVEAPETSFLRQIEELPREKMWGVMERINFRNACHYFLATHPKRASKNYTIDFSTKECFNYVPVFRYRCGVHNNAVFRGGSYDTNGHVVWTWSQGLDSTEAAIVRMVDGTRSIGDIVAEVHSRQQELNLVFNRVELERRIRKMFQALWRNDYITVDTSALVADAPAKKAAAKVSLVKKADASEASEKVSLVKKDPSKKDPAKKAPAKKTPAK